MIGIGHVTHTRRTRLRWFIGRHWRWLRGRGSRDNRVRFVPYTGGDASHSSGRDYQESQESQE